MPDGAGASRPARFAARRIAPDDPGAADVRALLEAHLALMRSISPPGSVHALDVDKLRGPDIAFFSMRESGSGGESGRLLAVGALKRHDGAHGEIKSMHTRHDLRRSGAGREMLRHLLAHAHDLGLVRVSLETGSTPDFAAAHALYRSNGFVDCGPFADYTADPFSLFLTRRIDPDETLERP